ncbi:hypothetical protein AGR13a_Cc30114 [Agrobacterium genomosp. 13 str. CFBP 6927]|uniref:Uncharacterized protein n=1 Tax=Agrobacterium genomosp. 13 str. CFBP 6927 TaxID=1183428 RepID=A0ABM9VFR3_9HYPH|nr:hypothetical protein AGR13a_Cc30114 [Agrobacterium genomosp. 13 str. CFBP 6927]
MLSTFNWAQISRTRSTWKPASRPSWSVKLKGGKSTDIRNLMRGTEERSPPGNRSCASNSTGIRFPLARSSARASLKKPTNCKAKAKVKPRLTFRVTFVILIYTIRYRKLGVTMTAAAMHGFF